MEAAVPAPAPAPAPRTLEDDLPQLAMENELSTFVDQEAESKSDQNARLAAVQDRLVKTMELKERVETLFVSELEAISEKLEAEGKAEIERSLDIEGLISKFDSVLSQKRAAVEKDESLLATMEATLSLVREAAIQKTMQAAITDKSTLCSIERELIAKMEQCLEQLADELAESNERKRVMEDVKSRLPEAGNTAAVRSYSWEDVEALKVLLTETAESAKAREANVESIKADFADAMERRRRILSGKPALPPPSPRTPAAAAATGATDAQIATGAANTAGASSPSSSAAAPATPSAPSSPSSSPKKALSNDELMAELGAATTELTGGVVQLTGEVVGVVANAETLKAASKAGSGASKAVSGVSQAISTAVAQWNKAAEETAKTKMGSGAKDDGTGEWWMKTAWSNVASSAEVKAALDGASEGAKDALGGLGEVGSTIAAKASAPKEGPSALDATVKSGQRVVTSLAAIFARITSGGNQLPSGK